MDVLIGCEFSGTVRDAFIARGHNALSCDYLPTERPGPHYQGDVRDLLKKTFDLAIFFPDCTHLAVSGAKHFEQKILDGRQRQAIDFFMLFTDLPNIRLTAIENPVGIMSTLYRKPDQIIQPFYFGDQFQKTTCLWLKGLPKLFHSPAGDLFAEKTHVFKGEMNVYRSGKKMARWNDMPPGSDRAKIRSRTFPGIAAAMAAQWG